MRRTLAAALLLISACAVPQDRPAEEAGVRSGLVVHEAAPLQPVDSQPPVARHVLASLTVTSCTCGRWTPGESVMVPAHIAIAGPTVTVEIADFPRLSGTLVGGEVLLQGAAQGLDSGGRTACHVTGQGTMDGITLVGHLSESRTGRGECATEVRFSL